MQKLFIYGTLQEPEIQKQIIGRLVNGKPATLRGFCKSTIEIEGMVYPILIKGLPDFIVDGKIIYVTTSELEKIDKYETNEYQRKEVILESGEKSWVYVK